MLKLLKQGQKYLSKDQKRIYIPQTTGYYTVIECIVFEKDCKGDCFVKYKGEKYYSKGCFKINTAYFGEEI